MPLFRAFCIAGLLTASTATALAATYGPELQGFQYPYPLNISNSNPKANPCKWATWTCRPKAPPMVAPSC